MKQKYVLGKHLSEYYSNPLTGITRHKSQCNENRLIDSFREKQIVDELMHRRVESLKFND